MFKKLILNKDGLPVRNGLIMGHVWPDSDSLCSCIALARHLSRQNKRAYVYVPNGGYPRFLDWLVDENRDIIIFDSDHPFCQNVDFLYILDTEPTEARTGFEIDASKHKFINIDHHSSRFKDVANVVDEIEYGSWLRGVDADGNEYYLENASSTSGLLVRLYGLKDDILALGLYHDTFHFAKKGHDACTIVSQLDVDDKRFEYMIRRCEASGTRKDFENLLKLRTWWDNSNDICVAHDESNTFENFQIVNFVNPYCKLLVVVSANKYVSLRSNVPDIDLGKIAKRMGGGGHKGAAAFRLSNLCLADLADTLRVSLGVKPLTDEERYSLQQFQKKITTSANKNTGSSRTARKET